MNWLPEHKCGLYLTHNEHKDGYESVEEFIANRNLELDFVSLKEIQKAIDEDSVWHLQWYPDTPIGSYSICASSLEAIEKTIRTKGQE